MKSGFLLFLFGVFVFGFSGQALFAADKAAGDKTQAQGQLLEQNEFLCGNCFFGTNSYYYCFEADNRILIGYQKTPALNWEDESKNALTKFHGSWKPWSGEGPAIPLQYDKKYIWVTRANGKTVKLKQDYSTDIFVNNSKCRSAVKKKTE